MWHPADVGLGSSDTTGDAATEATAAPELPPGCARLRGARLHVDAIERIRKRISAFPDRQ